jgi:hypothetical protein
MEKFGREIPPVRLACEQLPSGILPLFIPSWPATGRTSFGDHISHIVAMSAKKEVGWIAAGWVVAYVQNM